MDVVLRCVLFEILLPLFPPQRMEFVFLGVPIDAPAILLLPRRPLVRSFSYSKRLWIWKSLPLMKPCVPLKVMRVDSMTLVVIFRCRELGCCTVAIISLVSPLWFPFSATFAGAALFWWNKSTSLPLGAVVWSFFAFCWSFSLTFYS